MSFAICIKKLPINFVFVYVEGGGGAFSDLTSKDPWAFTRAWALARTVTVDRETAFEILTFDHFTVSLKNLETTQGVKMSVTQRVVKFRPIFLRE